MRHKPLFWFLLVLVLSIFSFKSLLRAGYFPMHDDMQVIRLVQLDKCFQDKQIPCRWVPDLGYGYGYPLFIYYSPLSYYVMEGFHLGGLSFIDSVKAEFIATFIFSGLAMFLLGRSLWGNFGGLVSSVFYLYAPYRAANVYTRGAVGEFTALVFLPLILWAILEFVRQNRIRYLYFLSFSLAGLLITHNITALIFSPIIIIWSLFLLWQNRKFHLSSRLLLGLLSAVGLAGFFVVPVIFEKSLVHVETMTYGYFNYLAHFATLHQLFFSTHWGFGSSELGPYDDLSFAIGIFHWLFALLALLIAFMMAKKDGFTFRTLILLGIIGLGAIFMTHQRSVFIWDKIQILSYLQFPWRFLTIVIFIVSLMTGALGYYLKRNRIVVGCSIIVLIILVNANYFTPSTWFNISDKEKMSGSLWEKQVTASIFDYLPIFAKAPPSKAAPNEPQILEGQANVSGFQKGTDWQKGEIKVTSDQATIQLPLFYFPDFKLKIDDDDTPFNYQNDLGLITFEVDKGEHNFYVQLENTLPRKMGNTLSLLSLLGMGGYLIYVKKSNI